MIGVIFGFVLLALWIFYVILMTCYFTVYGFEDAFDLMKVLRRYCNPLGFIYCIILFILTLPAVPLAFIVAIVWSVIKSLISIGFRKDLRYIKHKFYYRRNKRNAEISSSER